MDTLKQKLAVYSSRLRKYKESNVRKQQNNLFRNSEKRFYNNLNNIKEIKITPPSKEAITTFWQTIWSNPVEHNNTAHWIETEQQRYQHINNRIDITITTDEITQITKKTHNWKAPGVDGLQNYWYKHFTSTHSYLATCITDTIKHPHKTPIFLTKGKTYVKPKNNDTENPSNYRPITCLPTLYKIITSLITQKIESHLTQYNIMTKEQKCCRKQSQGCKEQLIIDSTILKQAEQQRKNLYTCYIDYKKAFDSVPHSWLRQVLEIYKVPDTLIHFLTHMMNTWRTKIHLHTDTQQIETEKIHIKRGIFQGDSLSALSV